MFWITTLHDIHDMTDIHDDGTLMLAIHGNGWHVEIYTFTFGGHETFEKGLILGSLKKSVSLYIHLTE